MGSMLPPVLLELRSSAAEFRAGVADAKQSLATLGPAGDAAAARLDASTAREAAAQDRLAAAVRVDSDSIRVSVAEQVAAEEQAAARVGAAYDAEARSAQLSAQAQQAAIAETVAAQKGARDAAAETVAAQGERDAAVAASAGGFGKYAGVVKVAAATAGAAVAVESVKMAADFQQQITLLHTAGGESQANLGVVAAGIKGIAQSTGTSLDQLTEGMYTVEKAGDRGADGLNVLKAAAQGAKAEGVDLGTATNALTSVMMSYHLASGQAVQTENMLVAGAGAAKTTMQNYAGALSTVLPVASAAGIGFAQVGGAIATLTQHGTSADEATQELANTIRNLQAPSQVAQKAMQQIGIGVTDLETGLGQRGLTGTLDLILDKMAGSSKDGMVVVNAFKQAQSATANLGTEIGHMSPQLAAMSQGFENGTISYKTYYTGAKALGGQQYELAKGFISTMNAAKGFNTLLTSGQPAQRTAAAELKDIMGGATGLNTALMLTGDNMPTFKARVNEISKAGQHAGANISTWGDTSKTLSVQLARVKQSAMVLATDIGGKLIPVVSAVTGFFLKHKAALEAVAVVLGTVMVAAIGSYIAKLTMASAETIGKLALMVAGWMGIGPAADAAAAETAVAGGVMDAAFGPVGLAIMAVVAVAALLATHWKQVWGAMKEAAEVVWRDAIKPVFDAMKPAFHAVGAVFHTVFGAMDKVFSFVADHWKQIVKVILAVVLGPLGLAIDALWTHWHAVWDAIKDAVDVAWRDVLKPVFGFIVEYGVTPIVATVRGLQRVWSDVWGAIKTVMQAAWDDVLKPVFGFIVEYGVTPIVATVEGFGQIWGDIWDGVKTAVRDVWDVIRPIINTIKSAIKDVTGAVSGVVGAVGGAIGDVGSFFGFDKGGLVPGPVGKPQAAMVHGGEYMLSYGMLTGAQPIDPAVAGAVMANLTRNTGAASQTAHLATYNSGSTGGMASPAGGSVQEIHTHVYLDGRQIQQSVERRQLQAGLRRGVAYQQFRKQ